MEIICFHLPISQIEMMMMMISFPLCTALCRLVCGGFKISWYTNELRLADQMCKNHVSADLLVQGQASIPKNFKFSTQKEG